MEFAEERYPFDSPSWIFEIKYDGYRVLATTSKDARLTTRRGANATAWFAEVVESLKTLPSGYLIDGEVAVLDDLGRSDFEQLQTRARARRWREGWRENFIASAIGLLASGCYAEAATHAAQARSSAAIPLKMGSLQQLRCGVDVIAQMKETADKSST